LVADVAELADALDSKSSTRKSVWVRPPPSAPSFIGLFWELLTFMIPDNQRMQKVEFPKVVRVGQTKATIYKTPSHGCDSFTIVWFEGAVRKRKVFATV
jgi:hypothetical protein